MSLYFMLSCLYQTYLLHQLLFAFLNESLCLLVADLKQEENHSSDFQKYYHNHYLLSRC